MVEPSADAPLVMRKLVHAAAGIVIEIITNSEANATAVHFLIFSSLLSIRDADDGPAVIVVIRFQGIAAQNMYRAAHAPETH